MCAISDSASDTDRFLYSPHKALDAVLGLGAIPQRLFRVFYPVWRVQVEGRQRIATDFEELEWFIERGLHEAGLRSVEELARFFGLEARFVRTLVGFLKGIGHIKGNETHLTLTELGLDSVKARVRFQDQETSIVLYFDGLGSRPLTREHYSVPVYADLPDQGPFRAISAYFCHWDSAALTRLVQRPDRSRYGLPDEFTRPERLAREPVLVYLPVYIIERRPGEPANLLLFLVFSRIRSRRDAVLEEAVNVESLARVSLHEARRHDLERAVENVLSHRGLDRDDWYLQPDSLWGPQVMVDARVLKQPHRATRDDEESRVLTVRDVGRYLLAYDWCVWVTCDDAEVRQQAAIERLLEWLQHVTATPTAEDLRQHLAVMRERLRIQPISIDTLMDAAEQRGLARALERLDALVYEWG